VSAVAGYADHVRGFDGDLAATLPGLIRRVPALADRVRAAGLTPDDLVSTAALDRLPVLPKDALVDLQATNPPFGGMLEPGTPVRRIFQSPGPIYEPEVEGVDPWRMAPALEAAGFAPGDVVLNAFSYHLTPGGAVLERGALALGCTVVPGGVGNMDLQLRACADLGVTAYIGLPSYLRALLERADELGFGPGPGLRRAFVTGEPLPASLRARLRERVPVVRQGYATAEAGNLGYECDAQEGLHVPPEALVQVCGLDDGLPVAGGEEGQVVVTLLASRYPLVRFGTGDLSAFLTDPCSCGRSTPRLAGVLGRAGEAVKVRGMFLHPQQLRRAMGDLADTGSYAFVVERVDDRDRLLCELAAPSPQAAEELRSRVRDRVRSALRFDVEVVIVDHVDPGRPLVDDRRTWD